MKVTFLGTNGWFDTKTGNTTCVLCETKEEYILFDAGSGLYKAFDIIKEDKPVFLFLTHLHMDHICGLQVLPLFNFKQGLKIIVEQAMKSELQNIMRTPYMPAPKELKMKVEIEELSPSLNLPFKITAENLKHPVPTIGYRLQKEDKILTFALDSGPCPALINLAKDADLFITECSSLPGLAPNDIHLNPQQAAQIAIEAKAKTMALIHFKADDYNTFEKRDSALLAAGHIMPHTIAPYDGESIEI